MSDKKVASEKDRAYAVMVHEIGVQLEQLLNAMDAHDDEDTPLYKTLEATYQLSLEAFEQVKPAFTDQVNIVADMALSMGRNNKIVQ